MQDPLDNAFGFNRRVRRSQYLAAGVVLFAIKYLLDLAVAAAFGKQWMPWNYLVWPANQFVGIDGIRNDQMFALAMLAVSLPFVAIGVAMTVFRLNDAGLPKALVVFFFIPAINVLFLLMLAALPAATPRRKLNVDDPIALRDAIADSMDLQILRRPALGRDGPSKPFAAIAGIGAGLVAVVVSVSILQTYAYGLFVGAPFVVGMVSALTLGARRPRSLGDCLSTAIYACLGLGGALLVFAFEGIICLAMAAPILVPLALLGACVGYAIQARPNTRGGRGRLGQVLLIALPGLIAAETATLPEPELNSVTTSIIVAAAPEAVWPHVIAFSPLPEPTEWWFKAGIAYPVRARIEGTGVGAIRYCEFSTGAFVEPIDVWQEPSRLAFAVAEQPPPMTEWSPWRIHPPHLDGYLLSRRGEFRLERLPDGGAKLIGTTWYVNRMWPAAYWRLWSDAIVHQIHARVLNHISGLATDRADRKSR